jgi:hypothetical protein
MALAYFIDSGLFLLVPAIFLILSRNLGFERRLLGLFYVSSNIVASQNVNWEKISKYAVAAIVIALLICSYFRNPVSTYRPSKKERAFYISIYLLAASFALSQLRFNPSLENLGSVLAFACFFAYLARTTRSRWQSQRELFDDLKMLQNITLLYIGMGFVLLMVRPVEATQSQRFQGIFENPNGLSAMSISAIGMALFLALEQPLLRKVVNLTLPLISLYLTNSRTGLIALMTTMIIWSMSAKFSRFMLFTLSALSLSLISWLMGFQSIVSRVFRIYDGVDTAFESRVLPWSESLKLIESKIWGYGPEAAILLQNNSGLRTSHNSFLALFIYHGVVSFILSCIMVIVVMSIIQSSFRYRHQYSYRGAMILIPGMISSISETGYFSIQFPPMILTWMGIPIIMLGLNQLSDTRLTKSFHVRN